MPCLTKETFKFLCLKLLDKEFKFDVIKFYFLLIFVTFLNF